MKTLAAGLTATLMITLSPACRAYDAQAQQIVTDGKNLVDGVSSDQVQIGAQTLDQGVTLITGATSDEKKDAKQIVQDGAGLAQGTGDLKTAAHDGAALVGDATQAQLDQGRALLNSGTQLLGSVSPEQRQQFATLLSDGQSLLTNPTEQQKAANLLNQGQKLAQQALNQTSNTGH